MTTGGSVLVSHAHSGSTVTGGQSLDEFLTSLDGLLGQLEYEVMDFSEEEIIAARIVDNSDKIVRELKSLDELNREEAAKLRKKEQQVLETQGIQKDNQKKLNKHLTTLVAESKGLRNSMEGLQAEQDNLIKALENQIKKPVTEVDDWEREEDKLIQELELSKDTLRLYVNIFGLRFNKKGVVLVGRNGRLLGASFDQPECAKLMDAVWAGTSETN